MEFDVNDVSSSINVLSGTEGSPRIYMNLHPKGDSFLSIDNVDILTSSHIPEIDDKNALHKIDGRLRIDRLDTVLEIDDVKKCISQDCCGFIEYREKQILNRYYFYRHFLA